LNKVYHNKDIGLTVYRDTDITRNPFINKLKDLLCGIQDINKDLEVSKQLLEVDLKDGHIAEFWGDLYYQAAINKFGFSASLKLFDSITQSKINLETSSINYEDAKTITQSNPILVDYMNHFTKQLKEHFGYKSFVLTKYWFNIHKNNSVGHPIHSHFHSVDDTFITEYHDDAYYSVPIISFKKFMAISTTYYVDVSDSSAPLNFYTDDEKEIDSIKLQTGDLVIFPATLNHGVPHKKNSDERIVIGSDVKVKV